ncbi:MAG: hypothetical protein WD648_15035 [Planctomycetaceae bacterium]
MTQPDLHVASGATDVPGSFAARPTSPGWERVSSAAVPGNAVWAWYKPAHLPQSVILRIPDEPFRNPQGLIEPWSMRKLLLAAGIDSAAVSMWHLFGVPYDAMGGASPFLDASLPIPVPGIDPNIPVHIYARPAEPTPSAPASADSGSAAELFERIEADWHSTMDIEKELKRLRKQLVDMMARLKTLNRDLTPTERLHSNNQDRKDWLDARRWLRDGSNRLWKCIKEHDIGDTSAAGQRLWFEQTYHKHVVPRKPFEGLLQAQRDFESYRKMVQTLQGNMTTAYSIAAIDGERRAQSVLARIATKVREATNKKNFLGVILDS